MRSVFQARILVALVLACFALAQNPAAELLHDHAHSGDHANGCLVCHAGHLPALQATSLTFNAPSAAVLHLVSDDRPLVAGRTHSSGSSRAPPA